MQTCSIVIPCFNEEKRLKKEKFLEFLKKNARFNFLFVNDGSNDRTGELLEGLKKENTDQIIIINKEKNEGKAEAVRSGIRFIIKNRKTDIAGFCDADLSISLQELARMSDIFTSKETMQAVFGSRIKKLGSHIERYALRHYMGRTFATVASLMLKLPVYDTQCGIKLFRNELARSIFEEKFISRWMFDVELFFRIIKTYGLNRTKEIVYEHPLEEWIEKKGSKICFSYFLKIPFELIQIYRHYKLDKQN